MTVALVERLCSMDNCEKPSRVRGWCNMHYIRWRRHGDPNRVLLIRGDGDRRLRSKIGVTLGGCWSWNGTPDPDGYGQVSVDGRPAVAHRVVYEHFVGPIPAGHGLHHTCENRICVKPAHLTPMTPGEHGTLHASMKESAAFLVTEKGQVKGDR